MAQPSPWDTSGTANSLADAIRRQADNQAKAAAVAKAKKSGVSATPNPLDQLMQQIQSIQVQATPFDQLMQQATGSAGAQFDPLIKQLEAEMARTEKRGKANQGEAKSMYNALATDIAAEMPQITEQMNAASQETQNRYDQTQQDLKNQYNSQAQQQAELFKQLGIQAATPGASQQASEDQAYFQQQSQVDEDAAMQLLSQMKNSDISYNQQSADNTRLAGVNAASDIGAQLEDYMQTAGGQMSGLKSGRESAIQGMLAQLQQQDAQRMQEQENTEYDRLMDMFNLQLKMQEMQNDANAKAGRAQDRLFKGTNGPSGASNYLSEIYGSGDTFTSKSIMDVLNDVMQSPEAVAGKYQSEEMKDSYGNPMTMDVTPEYLTDMLRQRMQEGSSDNPLGGASYNNADINNAINALLAYMGKLK
jgi:hypothetical protein